MAEGKAKFKLFLRRVVASSSADLHFESSLRQRFLLLRGVVSPSAANCQELAAPRPAAGSVGASTPMRIYADVNLGLDKDLRLDRTRRQPRFRDHADGAVPGVRYWAGVLQFH